MKKLLYLSLLLSVLSCKKAEDRQCLKSKGDNNSRRIELPDFTRLDLQKKLNYTLIQDDSNYLVIHGGKNLLNFVHWFVNEDGGITIENKNKCNFLRDLKQHIQVDVHFKNLNQIFYKGSGYMNCFGQLQFSAFYILIADASGTVDLNVQSDFLTMEIVEGSGNCNLSGSTINAKFETRDNGYYNAENFTVSNNLSVVQKSNADVHIKAENLNLTGFISGNGNVYAKGNPLTNSMQILSKGKFISY